MRVHNIRWFDTHVLLLRMILANVEKELGEGSVSLAERGGSLMVAMVLHNSHLYLEMFGRILLPFDNFCTLNKWQ